MRIPFSLAFLLVLLAEIAVYIRVGEALGVLATLGLTLLGMVVGMSLLRSQGIATLMRVRAEIEAGRTPTHSIVNGAILAAAALLIILPGFLTDIAGLLLFIPPVREALWRFLQSRTTVRTTRSGPGPQRQQGPVVELDRSEYGARRDSGPRGDSPWRQSGGPGA